MKKRGLASLLIVTIVAIASVIGVIFAFQNAGREKDAYADMTVSVDRNDIPLEIELERDPYDEQKFRIVETPYSSAIFTITVGGIPTNANHLVEPQKNDDGNVAVTRVGSAAEAYVTGINKFMVTGLNGSSAPIPLKFTTLTAVAQTVTVNVTVNMVAKDMKLDPKAHFGIRQGGNSINLKTLDSKYIYYAHPEDVKRDYIPNKYPVEYRLGQDYAGVILEEGRLTVTDQATCVDDYLDLQVKLPEMQNWLSVPVYVFPKAETISIKNTDAYKSPSVAMEEIEYGKEIWDLIANRDSKSSALFEFELDCDENDKSSYIISAKSKDDTRVETKYDDVHKQKFSSINLKNLGEVAVEITASPIVKHPLGGGPQITYDLDSDTDVQVTETIYLRVRNEFYRADEIKDIFKLTSNKETVNAFAYQGDYDSYYDVFSLDLLGNKNNNTDYEVNTDADVEFELEVVDRNNTYTGVYNKDGGPKGWNLYDILDIRYLALVNGKTDWVSLTADDDGYYTNYRNQFSVAFVWEYGKAKYFFGENISSLILRAKSVNQLSIDGYATCEIRLDPVLAIDEFYVENLTKLNSGEMGVALVCNKETGFTSIVRNIDVYGKYIEGGHRYDSQSWDAGKVSDNSADLSPFEITCEEVPFEVDNVSGYHHLRYTFSVSDVNLVQPYVDYPLTIKYVNLDEEQYCVIHIIVYPTVESMSMSVVSSGNGVAYQTITNKVQSAGQNNSNNSYDYIRTVYVRKGDKYRFAVNTPGVNVGAYTTVDEINGQTNPNPQYFDATNLAEGLYTCTVNLHAYNDEVYKGHEQANQANNQVNIVVVDPIVNEITLPTEVRLNGIGNSENLVLSFGALDGSLVTNNADWSITTLDDGTVVTNSGYWHIVLPKNEYVEVEPGNPTESNSAFNKFTISAKYLINDTIRLGFKIYKSYAWDQVNDGTPFNFYYIGGASVNTNVQIADVKTKVILVEDDNVNSEKKIGDYRYLEVVSSPVTPVEITVKDNSKLGVWSAKWKDGKYELSPFVPYGGVDITDNINNVNEVVVEARVSGRKVTVTPKAGKTSLGNKALVIYSRDSLRYVDSYVDETGELLDRVLPDEYVIIGLYVGSATEVSNTINEMKKVTVPAHDANSGKLNDRGSYNWIVPSSKKTEAYAALFYTPGTDNGNGIPANKYRFDDLSNVLGWTQLKNVGNVYLEKIIAVKDGEGNVTETEIGNGFTLDDNGEVKILDLNRKYAGNNSDEEMYSHDNIAVIIRLICGNTYDFYVVRSIDEFDVIKTGENGTGTAAIRNLNPKENTKLFDTVQMQRGCKIDFTSNLEDDTGWQLKTTDFTNPEQTKLSSYNGGTYTFYPTIKFTRENKSEVNFNLTALTAKIKVDVFGGVSYLKFAQDSIALESGTTATYNLSMVVDQENWSSNLLTYSFVKNGVYFDLFNHDDAIISGDTMISYVNLEGGKAKLEFRLTCSNHTGIPNGFSYIYYLKIQVSVIIVTPDVDPFYDIEGASLYVRENLAAPSIAPLAKNRIALETSTSFSLKKSGIDDVTLSHFAQTSVAENNRSALRKSSGQTDSNVIYLDADSAGGLLTIHPTPYYINVSKIEVKSGNYLAKVPVGKNLSGETVYADVNYSIGFTQMIYNEDEKYYQPYLGETGAMVSSWSLANGYKWNGNYYFRTYITTPSHVAYRLPDNTKFEIQVVIQGANSQPITRGMTLYAKYRDSIIVTPNKDVEDYAVRTMTQTQYQALGTSKVYDVAFPEDCAEPDYKKVTFNGISSTTGKIQSTYATVTISGQTLTVELNPDVKAIGQTLEVRIPYNRPGDFINPYLSVVIVPVYFELDDLEVINHYEAGAYDPNYNPTNPRSRIAVTNRNDLLQLQYRALFDYNTNMLTSSLNEKMTAFNNSLLSPNALSCDLSTGEQINVQVSYSYENGVPVLTKNGDFRYSKTFYYTIYNELPEVPERVEYLAVGTSKTYTFYNWDAISAPNLYLQSNDDNSAIQDYWSRSRKVQNRNTVMITVSLENNLENEAKNSAYESLVEKGKDGGIVINVRAQNNTAVQLRLIIIPVYFTFDEFQLQNNPERPLLAPATPTIVTVKAGGIKADTDSSLVASKIDEFNENFKHQQNVTFDRIANDGIVNFNFDPDTREIVRNDLDRPIDATSYLLITSGVTYIDGVPTLGNTGDKIATYIPVKTFGEESEENGSSIPGLDKAPVRSGTYAQAINTKVRYDIAISGVAYDYRLYLYEKGPTGAFDYEMLKASETKPDWNATLDVRNSIITVTLGKNTELLFNKVLVIMAYSQENELIYVLNIIPAYFTVDQILLTDHLGEDPVMIKSGNDSWLHDLALDFGYTTAGNPNEFDFDFDTAIATFRETLQNSGLVLRIDDGVRIALTAGVDYTDGIPTLVEATNVTEPVQTIYRYEIIDGIPENTKVQTIGTDVIYDVNCAVSTIKISTGTNPDGSDIWTDCSSVSKTGWYIDWQSSSLGGRKIKVTLEKSSDLIHQLIRIGAFTATDTVEPSYIINIIPAYFAVDDLTAKGQSVNIRDIYLYYGEEQDSPENVIFDVVIRDDYPSESIYGVVNKIEELRQDLQGTSAGFIAREYPIGSRSGDLDIVAYFDYSDGYPALTPKPSESENNRFVVPVGAEFKYATVLRESFAGKDFPPMPTGPRTRKEVQAIGTTDTYTIDLTQYQNVSLDAEACLGDGWEATFVDGVFTLNVLSGNLLTNARSNGQEATFVIDLLKKDLVFKFYSGSSLVYVLTIQPVLFEVIGVETIYPEQPANIHHDINLQSDIYRAVVRYNDQITWSGTSIRDSIESFNAKINSNLDLLEIEEVKINGIQYLRVALAVDYSGSQIPELLNVTNNPLNDSILSRMLVPLQVIWSL